MHKPTHRSGAPLNLRADVAVSGELHRPDVAALLQSSSAVGTATHRLIALCALLDPWPTPELILAVAERHLPRRRNTNSRQALLTAATSMAGIYFRRYRMADTTLEAIEEPVADLRLDLVWRTDNGLLIADEIKTGVFSWPSNSTRAQAIRQVRAGREHFGSNFHGVRVAAIRSGNEPTYFPAQDWV